MAHFCLGRRHKEIARQLIAAGWPVHLQRLFCTRKRTSARRNRRTKFLYLDVCSWDLAAMPSRGNAENADIELRLGAEVLAAKRWDRFFSKKRKWSLYIGGAALTFRISPA